ncbi:MAG: hypothetical protein ACJ768_09305 [Gaiellaceae bacterium]
MTLPHRSDGGWSFLGGQARKAHYFPSPTRGTQALCGKWMISIEHPLEPDNGKPSSDDCAACRRKLDAQAARDA